MNIARMTLVGMLLSGCAAAPLKQALAPVTVEEQAVDEKLYAAIEHRLDLALQSGKEPGKVWADYGELYMKQAELHPENAMFFKRKATSAFTIAAQYGDKGARDVLVRNDIPVPDVIFKD
jgi:hypothetical protein